MKDKAVLNDDGLLYSSKEYSLRFGTHRETIESLFHNHKILSFDDIFSALSKCRPDITERRVHGIVQGSGLVLADRGKYMLRSSLPKIDKSTINATISDINKSLSKNPNGLLSLGVIFKRYRKLLEKQGCTSPYMLFEIIKAQTPSEIRFIKCPYVTSAVTDGRFSITTLLEDYINDNGSTPLSTVRNYFVNEVGVSPAVFSRTYMSSDNLLVDDDNNLVSIDELGIDKSMLLPFENELSNLDEMETITAGKLFSDNKVTCLFLNIKGPKLLFNVLKLFESDKYSFRFPQISKSKYNFSDIRSRIVDFILETGSFCTIEQIEDYCTSNHLSKRNLNFKHSECPDIFKYLPGAWVHIYTIGWFPNWTNTICSLAREVLDNSISPKKSYEYLDAICDRENELPTLENDLWWTSTLIGDILESSGEFLVYGKNKSIFSVKGGINELENFGDLCALLLDEEFDGASNLHTFSNYLRSKRLISNDDLHPAAIHGSKRIVITGQEVYTIKEH